MTNNIYQTSTQRDYNPHRQFANVESKQVQIPVQKQTNQNLQRSHITDIFNKQTEFQQYRYAPSKNLQPTDPFRGDNDKYLQNLAKQQKNYPKSDPFSGVQQITGGRKPVPEYYEYCKMQQQEQQVYKPQIKQFQQHIEIERPHGKKHVPEPKFEEPARISGKRPVQPPKHYEEIRYYNPKPRQEPSNIFRSTNDVPQLSEAAKNYKFRPVYAQIGENEKIQEFKPRNIDLWKSHTETIVGVQYPKDLTDQPIAIDGRKVLFNENQNAQQLKNDAQWASIYRKRAFGEQL